MNNKAFVWHMKNMCKGSIFSPENTSNLSEKSEQGRCYSRVSHQCLKVQELTVKNKSKDPCIHDTYRNQIKCLLSH